MTLQRVTNKNSYSIPVESFTPIIHLSFWQKCHLMQISFSVRIILKEVLSPRNCISDLCLISEGWATALLQLHNINPYNTGLLWQLMSLNSLDSKDFIQSCQVVQFNAVQSFAPVRTGRRPCRNWGFTQALRGGIWALQLKAFLTSELCTASPEAFQAPAEVSKLVFGCSNTELPRLPEKYGSHSVPFIKILKWG